MKKNKYIIIDLKDNCGTALEKIPQGAKIDFSKKTIEINNVIPLGHKFALIDIKKGSSIIKYGEIIGFATEDIYNGDWIHTHNIKSTYQRMKNNG